MLGVGEDVFEIFEFWLASDQTEVGLQRTLLDDALDVIVESFEMLH